MRARSRCLVSLFTIALIGILSIAFSDRGGSVELAEIVPLSPPRYHDCVIVLMYHDIGFVNQRRGVITPELFESHMRYLKEMGYNPISSEAFEKFISGRGKVPDNAVLITFDDGYESFYRYAYPILRKYGFPAICFVIVSDIEETNHGKNARHLAWNEMREMQASGLISFGSHTYNSHYYALVDQMGHAKPVLAARIYDLVSGRWETQEAYRMRVSGDLWLSKYLLEQNLHIKVASLCFPYGAYNSAVIDIARELGYEYFYTVRGGVNRPGRDAVFIKRVSCGDSYMTVSELDRRLSGLFWPSWPFIDRLKKGMPLLSSSRHFIVSHSRDGQRGRESST